MQQSVKFAASPAMRTRLETPFLVNFFYSLNQATGCTEATECMAAAITEVLTNDGVCGSA